MRKILLCAILTVMAVGIEAQSIREEIRDNIRCSAGNYLAYPEPAQLKLTPAPEGKHPFYISHYGRHGSRYLIGANDYEAPYAVMAEADSLGKLTPLGKDVVQRLDIIRKDAHGRYGELTRLGALQHQQIMRRMVDRFPEVFAEGADVDARSTTSLRVFLSMENAMMQLSRMCPKVFIHHNATQRDMYYLCGSDPRLEALRQDSATQALLTTFSQRYDTSSRLMQSLFNDTAYVRQHIDADKFSNSLYELANSLQNTDLSLRMTLYDLFTDDELYDYWRKGNAWWYVNYGFCPASGGSQPYCQRTLLRKIINDADVSIQLKQPGAQLRYGHDTMLLPLVCLLEIIAAPHSQRENRFGLATADLESLDRKGWANYKVIPMAGNLQLVFYRSSPDDTDVVVKVLLNENEVQLPLKNHHGPYYLWRDFREYYLKKLDAYEESEK